MKSKKEGRDNQRYVKVTIFGLQFCFFALSFKEDVLLSIDT